MRKRNYKPYRGQGHVKELDRLSNLYYKSRDEKYLEEWYQLTKKLASLLSPVSEEEQLPLRKKT